MSAQVTPIKNRPLSAGHVLTELLKLKDHARRAADQLIDYAAQCEERRHLAKRNAPDQVARFKAMRSRAIDRAVKATELLCWCDEAYTDWTFGKLTAKEVLGNVHMAHEMLTHIGHPAGRAA